MGVDNSVNKMLGPGRFDSGPEEGAPSRKIGVAERPRRQNFRHQVSEKFFELGPLADFLPVELQRRLELAGVDQVELLVSLQRRVANQPYVTSGKAGPGKQRVIRTVLIGKGSFLV